MQLVDPPDDTSLFVYSPESDEVIAAKVDEAFPGLRRHFNTLLDAQEAPQDPNAIHLRWTVTVDATLPSLRATSDLFQFYGGDGTWDEVNEEFHVTSPVTPEMVLDCERDMVRDNPGNPYSGFKSLRVITTQIDSLHGEVTDVEVTLRPDASLPPTAVDRNTQALRMLDAMIEEGQPVSVEVLTVIARTLGGRS